MMRDALGAEGLQLRGSIPVAGFSRLRIAPSTVVAVNFLP